MAATKVHPSASVPLDETSAPITSDLSDVNDENALSESKVEQKESENGDAAAVSPKRKKKIWDHKSMVQKYRSIARPRTGSFNSIGHGRSRRSDSSADQIIGGSLGSEHLGKADYDQFAWEWPDTHRAEEFGNSTVFDEGKATNNCISDDVFQASTGVGLVLYFAFLKESAILFSILSVLSLPMLILTYSGNRVEKDFNYDGVANKKDFYFYLSSFSVGNLGTDRLPYIDRNKCSFDSSVGWNYNGTELDGGSKCGLSHLTVFGNDIPMTDVANIFQFVDLLIVFVYMVYCFYFAERVKKIRADTDRRQLTIGDYAIFVDGIPPETQREDIRDHFENLYRLDEDYTWKKCCKICCNKEREKVEGYVPTHEPIEDDTIAHFDPQSHHYDQNDDEKNTWHIKGGWIAEVAMAQRKGNLIGSFNSAQKLLLKAKRLRATIKKYGGGQFPSTNHPAFSTAEGAKNPKWMNKPKENRKKWEKAKADLIKVEKKMEQVTAKGRKSKHMQDVVGAFVTFNHVESARRCLDDYAPANSFIGRLLMPADLRFKISRERLENNKEYWGEDNKPKPSLLDKDGNPKEYRITVTAAPEPNSIMWENLEVKGWNKCLRQAASIGVSVLCIIVSIIFITVGKTLREQAISEAAPNSKICPILNTTEELPHLASMYFSGYGDKAKTAGYVVRPPYESGKHPEDVDGARLDGLSGGTTMNFDEMCNPSSVSGNTVDAYAYAAALQNSHKAYYFQFDRWKRPAGLYPVWVCRNSEVVCWPEIQKDHSEKWTVPGMEDKDFNGVVDDGLCRWHPNDVVKECKASTTDTDTVKAEGAKADPPCLFPTEAQIKASNCKADFDRKDAVVLRWNVLPMYPFDRGTQDQITESTSDTFGIELMQRVECEACSDLKFHVSTPTQDKSAYINGVSDEDKKYCCKERDRFANAQTNPSEVTSTFGTEILNSFVDTLTDFGPLDRSRAQGPKREGLQRKDKSYYFPSRDPGSDDEFPPRPYLFEPNKDQKDILRKAYENFVQGPCTHPCTFINSTGLICPTLSCVSEKPEHRKVECKQYTPSTLAGCYCESLISRHSSAVDKFWAAVALVQDLDPVCGRYLSNVLQGTITAQLALVIVIAINVVLTRLLRKLAMIERPANWGHYFAKASFLIFWSRFVNIAWVIMVVNAQSPGPSEYLETRIPGTLAILRSFFIFGGTYRDFGVRWYRYVGTALVITLLMNIVEPHGVPLVKFLLQKIMICCCKRGKVMQYDLNKLYSGQEFEPEVRYPQVLTTIFVTLWFAGAMPIALPMAALALMTTYFVDKILILRVYNNTKIAMLDGTLVEWVSKVLPLAAVLHLFITIYVYGSDDVMYDLRWGTDENLKKLVSHTVATTVTNTSDFANALGNYEEIKTYLAANDPFDVVPRFTRENTILMVVTFVLVVLILLLKGIIEPLVQQALGACGVLKAYVPREDGDGNDDAKHTKNKSKKLAGFDSYTKQCSVPYTGEWHIKVMKAHLPEFFKYYEALGYSRKMWKLSHEVREKSFARAYTKIKHVGEDPTHNKVCCLKMKTKESENDIEWVVVKQVWMDSDVNIRGEKHKINRAKKVWEVCGSHSGEYSYFMYLNPRYELAFVGVAAELNMDFEGELLETSIRVEELEPGALDNTTATTPDAAGTPLPPLVEEKDEGEGTSIAMPSSRVQKVNKNAAEVDEEDML